MHKNFSLSLLLGGEALIIFRICTLNSVGAEISRLSTDWMLTGGILATIVGVVGMLHAAKAGYSVRGTNRITRHGTAVRGFAAKSSKVHEKKSQSLQTASLNSQSDDGNERVHWQSPSWRGSS